MFQQKDNEIKERESKIAELEKKVGFQHFLSIKGLFRSKDVKKI